ncbi:aldo-keto reductase family protein [Haloarcula brevis]|uniref:hypothetical protein n=1 Tax=Haloarcula brevis TaxID=3111453 RepID=UPI00300F3A91
MSELALGTIYFGNTIDYETVFEILDILRGGGRLLDTVNNDAAWPEGYDEPQSESLLGEWLEERGVRGFSDTHQSGIAGPPIQQMYFCY